MRLIRSERPSDSVRIPPTHLDVTQQPLLLPTTRTGVEYEIPPRRPSRHRIRLVAAPASVAERVSPRPTTTKVCHDASPRIWYLEGVHAPCGRTWAHDDPLANVKRRPAILRQPPRPSASGTCHKRGWMSRKRRPEPPSR
jgi:hypothetical protein